MNLTTLQRMRLIVPGFLLLLIILFIGSESFNGLTHSFLKIEIEDWPYLLFIILFGVFYYAFNVRNIVWKPFREKIDGNIKNALIADYRQGLSEDDIKYLKDGRRLMNIFYHFIDNDKSLTEKANRVRFNGLLWTSSIDTFIISIFGIILFVIKLITSYSFYTLMMFIILIVIIAVSYLLIHVFTKKHITLSDEQLDSICQLHKAELKIKLEAILNARS